MPSGYGSGAATLPPASGGMLWRLRNPERQPARAAPADAGHAAGSLGAGSSPPLVPVYRSAPYRAEAARQRRPSPTARILFLDEGCGSRAVLAAALLQAMLRCALKRPPQAGAGDRHRQGRVQCCLQHRLATASLRSTSLHVRPLTTWLLNLDPNMCVSCRKLSAPLDAEVTAASIGPPLPGGHDKRVAAVAREMDVTLQPVRRPRSSRWLIPLDRIGVAPDLNGFFCSRQRRLLAPLRERLRAAARLWPAWVCALLCCLVSSPPRVLFGCCWL